MSLLDNDFNIDNDILYEECIKYMLNTSNYLYPHKQSLGMEIRTYKERLPNIRITAPSHVPDYFLIGYDIDLDINCLQFKFNSETLCIRLFDPNLIKISENDVVYEDDKEKHVYTFDKIHLQGYFGRYRLCTHLVYNSSNSCNRYGHLVLPATDIINKCIAQKYFLCLPNTPMECYVECYSTVEYRKKPIIELYKIEEENILN